ncbi:OmpA family protein [Putridiphycobacter roseus]|nr:OmpA family protein [Putridiphycobacter roseus]
MNRKFKTINIFTLSILALGGTMSSCVGDSNSPGLEYMPDMYRSPAVEAYVDYGQILGKYNLDIVAAYKPGLAPAGTIPTTSNAMNDLPYEHGAPIGFDKSHGLYGMPVDSTGYADAAGDLNPIAYTEKTKKEAKVIYQNFCIHCHGEKGDGQGTVVTNGGFPPPPAYGGALKDLSAGQIFYSVTYGKGLMGSHASQLTKEERWKVVHHVEELQGKVKEVEVELLFDANTDTDGDHVMDNMDECPTVAGSIDNHGCPAVSEAVAAVLEGAIRGLVFTTGSATINPSSFKSLNGIRDLMQQDSTATLILNGHTDNVGNAASNQTLSLLRAKSVRDYLVTNGIDSKRINPIGYGQTKPKVSNDTEEGKLANRRVEFRLY